FITQISTLPICLPSSKYIKQDFYLTLLDSACSVVLGYNWLTCYNPMIDWVLGSITFRPSSLDRSNPTSMSNPSARTALLPSQNSLPSTLLENTSAPPHIGFINAAAFLKACKLPGAQSFRLHLSDPPSISAKSASASDSPDLSK